MINKEQLIREGEKQGISISKADADRLDLFAELLVSWNQKINLTSILEPEQVVTKHFVDSLLLVHLIPESARVLDIGAGGGFPSAPIAILRPDLQVVQMDSLQKRIRFLKEVKEELSLLTEPVAIRVEEAGKKEEFREQFDFVTARAVAALPILCEYALPLTKVGGRFAPLKGPGVTEELLTAKGAVRELGGIVEEQEERLLADGSRRTLLMIKKISQTPTKYPRNAARITKKPLFLPE